jgi:hypothetical protein
MTHEFLKHHGIAQHQVNKTDDGQTWSFWVGIEKANQMCEFRPSRAKPGLTLG